MQKKTRGEKRVALAFGSRPLSLPSPHWWDRVGVGGLAVICLLVTGCYGKSTPETITIGHVVSLSGPDKAAGEQARRGILLAVEEANENLVGGRRVEVLHGDYGEDKKAIAGVAVRLVKINNVRALLGGTDLAQAEALPRLAQQYQIPLLLSCGIPGEVSREYVFHTGIRPARQAQGLAQLAAEKLKAKTVGILTDGHSSLSSFLADTFSKKFTEQGAGFSIAGKWIYKEFRKGTGTSEGEWEFKSAEDLKAILSQLQDRHPDAILLAGDAPDLIKLGKSGFDPNRPMLFAGEEGGQQILQAARLAQVVYLATAFASEDQANKLVQNFVLKFKNKFQEIPDVHAALAYDNARLLFQGLADVKQVDSGKVKESLDKQEPFEGVSGRLEFEVKDRWYSRPVIIIQIQNGLAKFVEEYQFGPEKQENQ
jgi:branched-chain amino acid transport system substrate-binding protein